MENSNKTSSKGKIVIGILVTLLVVACAVIVFFLIDNDILSKPSKDKGEETNNSSDTKVNDLDNALKNISDSKSLEFVLDKLDGCRKADNLFLYFVDEDDKSFIDYGLYATSYGVHGEIKKALSTGDKLFSLNTFVAAVPANDMDDAKPEREEVLYFDLSSYEQDNKIKVKIENLDDGDWHTYEYGGKTIEEAFN